MYKIGELAGICGVSQKAIRFYERKGLLKPTMVNDETGYRYYDNESIKTIEKIKNLKKIGLFLKEIKAVELDSKNLEKFIDQKYKELQVAIRTLYIFDSEKGELKMKNFVNDENALGKWAYIGCKKSKSGELKNEPYFLNEIIFIQNGQGYWVIKAWSKGELYIYPGEYPIPEVYPYEIEGDKLFVSIINEKTKEVEKIAVYSRVDSKKYSLKELERKDNTDIPFQMDKSIVGMWKGIAMVDKPVNFIPNIPNFPSTIFDISFEKDGGLIIRYTDGRVVNQKWTKGQCLDTLNSLAPKYEIINAGDKEYLFIENKNGDYIYNGNISSYFVFERN